MKHIHL